MSLTGRFLASEHYGVNGDMVTLAKGLGGGVPIGALLMTEPDFEAFISASITGQGEKTITHAKQPP